MSSIVGRPLHWVFKIGDRQKSIHFFRDVLGMRVLRHEEFHEGCEATCNGPYNGRWSKTMIGYGSEDDHFVIELTYNYGIASYKRGNDFINIGIQDSGLYDKILGSDYSHRKEGEDKLSMQSPDGYTFIVEKNGDGSRDPVQGVSISVSNLSDSLAFWRDALQMKQIGEESKTEATLVYPSYPHKLNLKLLKEGEKFDRGSAFGRIAFAVNIDLLPFIEKQAKKVLTPFTKLDTPGKATVAVVILADPVSATTFCCT